MSCEVLRRATLAGAGKAGEADACSPMPRIFGSAFRRSALQFVEGDAEFLFLFQQFGEVDAQFGGFGFDFGEAEG